MFLNVPYLLKFIIQRCVGYFSKLKCSRFLCFNSLGKITRFYIYFFYAFDVLYNKILFTPFTAL